MGGHRWDSHPQPRRCCPLEMPKPVSGLGATISIPKQRKHRRHPAHCGPQVGKGSPASLSSGGMGSGAGNVSRTQQYPEKLPAQPLGAGCGQGGLGQCRCRHGWAGLVLSAALCLHLGFREGFEGQALAFNSSMFNHWFLLDRGRAAWGQVPVRWGMLEPLVRAGCRDRGSVWDVG